MKYKNVELTELQSSDWDGHPRLMLVWRNSDYYPSALRVEGYVHLEECECLDEVNWNWDRKYIPIRDDADEDEEETEEE